MGLFSHKKQDRNQGKNTPAPDKPAPDFLDFSGMQVEVLSSEDSLLFTARLSVSDNGKVRMWQASEGFVPPFEPPLPVKLRGYFEHDKKAVHFEGEASLAQENLWDLENFRLVSEENDRAFFRENTKLTGDVRLVGWVGADSRPCEVVNLSAGGVCIRSEEEYQKDDKLLLTTTLHEGAEAVTLLCEVRRVTPKNNGQAEYGCRFVDLDGSREDQIVETIMELQRQKLRR